MRPNILLWCFIFCLNKSVSCSTEWDLTWIKPNSSEQVCHCWMNGIISAFCSHFFAFLTWSELFSVPQFASVLLTVLSAVSPAAVSVFVILCFDYNPTPSLSPCLSLFSLLSSDSNGLSECSCDSVALRQKVAALWMWGKEKRKRLLPDCPGTKKRDTFFISYLAYEKKNKQDGGKECWGRGWGNCWAQCKEVKLFSLGTCLKGWAEAWKVSQRKILNN